MWKSIGEQYWRNKENRIQQFLAEKMSKLDIEEIQNIQMQGKTSDDPLDSDQSFIQLLPRFDRATGTFVVPDLTKVLSDKPEIENTDDEEEEEDDNASLFDNNGMRRKKKGAWYQSLLQEFSNRAKDEELKQQQIQDAATAVGANKQQTDESLSRSDDPNKPVPRPFSIDSIWQSDIHPIQPVHLSVSIRELEGGAADNNSLPSSPVRPGTNGGLNPQPTIHPTAMPGSVYDWMNMSLSRSLHSGRAMALGDFLLGDQTISTTDSNAANFSPSLSPRSKYSHQQDNTSPVASNRPDPIALTGHTEYKRLKKSLLGKSLRGSQYETASFNVADRLAQVDDEFDEELDDEFPLPEDVSRIGTAEQTPALSRPNSREQTPALSRPNSREQQHKPMSSQSRKHHAPVLSAPSPTAASAAAAAAAASSSVSQQYHQDKAHHQPQQHDDHHSVTSQGSTAVHQKQVKEYLELIQTPHQSPPQPQSQPQPAIGQSMSTTHLPSSSPTINQKKTNIGVSQSESQLPSVSAVSPALMHFEKDHTPDVTTIMEHKDDNNGIVIEGKIRPRSHSTIVSARSRNARLNRDPSAASTRSSPDNSHKNNHLPPTGKLSARGGNEGKTCPSPSRDNTVHFDDSERNVRFDDSERNTPSRFSTGNSPAQNTKFSPVIQQQQLQQQQQVPKQYYLHPSSTHHPHLQEEQQEEEENYVMVPRKDGTWDMQLAPQFNPFVSTIPPLSQAPLPLITPPATPGIYRIPSPSSLITRQELAQTAAAIAEANEGIDVASLPGYGVLVQGKSLQHSLDESKLQNILVLEDDPYPANARLVEAIGLYDKKPGTFGGNQNRSASESLLITDEDEEDLNQMIKVFDYHSLVYNIVNYFL